MEDQRFARFKSYATYSWREGRRIWNFHPLRNCKSMSFLWPNRPIGTIEKCKIDDFYKINIKIFLYRNTGTLCVFIL